MSDAVMRNATTLFSSWYFTTTERYRRQCFTRSSSKVDVKGTTGDTATIDDRVCTVLRRCTFEVNAVYPRRVLLQHESDSLKAGYSSVLMQRCVLRANSFLCVGR